MKTDSQRAVAQEEAGVLAEAARTVNSAWEVLRRRQGGGPDDDAR